ncbi:LLM class flavin-dependent oxidoreductase [Agromyces atrinae]|uniref:Alkanesulfonate monooxygenase SsuD/methylene tetrahydromethanopterin reductase-like flavin-dependent oxidoreductase (Luciferase family) n=1 Tax=Agromyces atrinae TaxID=592376 RepID=A0A4Q2MA80_9MICO|nr:LLM class flavin-dependent oxidoreductase [Agromyces atrinae]NYD67307.1 alkanesulfonate monooxygenase SsuD/methylene tetrahydromethanopterin reductase-like flavin-dependent oxidoreductase (luciferase family) [Agromyces atrinae]RXZ86862.1 LLM class flavin-dependent oxidoreductase [Agromyces atrinae]
MRFQILDIIPYLANPVTGRQVSPAERFDQTLELARRAERLGFDAISVGERHAGRFLSSAPSVILGAIASQTSTIRLQTGVTVLSVLDPVRVAEDYATIDQLSRGRLEITIGKGNEVAQFPLFGLEIDDQWELLADKYALLRRLWRETDVDWDATPYTRAQHATTTLPRPFAGAPRVWHGSATTLASAALAARHGDPLFSANAIQPLRNYEVLVRHYRDEFERHGHDPRFAYVGAGSGSLFIADSTAEARELYGPVYEAIVAATNVPGNNSPFRDIDHAIAEGPALVGTAEQVIEKIARFHGAFDHDLQSISLPTTLPIEQQYEILERFAAEVVPVVRREFPTTLWGEGDPYATRPAVHGATEKDAASAVSAHGRLVAAA